MARKKRNTKKKKYLEEKGTFLGFKLNMNRVNCLFTWPDMKEVSFDNKIRNY